MLRKTRSDWTPHLLGRKVAEREPTEHWSMSMPFTLKSQKFKL